MPEFRLDVERSIRGLDTSQLEAMLLRPDEYSRESIEVARDEMSRRRSGLAVNPNAAFSRASNLDRGQSPVTASAQNYAAISGFAGGIAFLFLPVASVSFFGSSVNISGIKFLNQSFSSMNDGGSFIAFLIIAAIPVSSLLGGVSAMRQSKAGSLGWGITGLVAGALVLLALLARVKDAEVLKMVGIGAWIGLASLVGLIHFSRKQ